MNIWLQVMLVGLIVQLTGVGVRTKYQEPGNWMNITGLFIVMMGVILYGVTEVTGV